ncbi:unnamed protein product [Boreogadus saida]
MHYYMKTAKKNYPSPPEPLKCTGSMETRELRFSRAMAFAINEINNSSDLLPGVALGYKIHDSCASTPMAVQSNSDYGNNGMASFLRAAQKEGICVEYSESFNRNDLQSKIQQVAEVIRRSTAMVVVAFTAPEDLRVLLEELTVHPSPPRQWIGSEAWVAASHVLTEFWEGAFNCLLEKRAGSVDKVCDGTEDIQKLQNPYTDTSQLRITNMVYKAVYAIAHAIHYMVCKKINSKIHCDQFMKIEPIQVLDQLKRVNFSRNGYHVSFDANGDPVAFYELINWQINENGGLEFVTVGHYDESLSPGQKFNIKSKISWADGGIQVPVSICSDSCPPGTRKVLQKGKPVCCYDCVPCAEGEISNSTDSSDCSPCPNEFWPIAEKNFCRPKIVEFLSFH